MKRGTVLSESRKNIIVEMYEDGFNQNEIARRLDISYSSVHRTLQERGIIEIEKRIVKESIPTQIEKTDSLNGLEAKIDDLIEEFSWIKNKMKIETLEMKDVGFKEINGTWVSANMKVNLGSSRIITFYILRNKGRSDEKWEAMSLDPKLIEAVWTEMKTRGWDWYK